MQKNLVLNTSSYSVYLLSSKSCKPGGKMGPAETNTYILQSDALWGWSFRFCILRRWRFPVKHWKQCWWYPTLFGLLGQYWESHHMPPVYGMETNEVVWDVGPWSYVDAEFFQLFVPLILLKDVKLPWSEIDCSCTMQMGPKLVIFTLIMLYSMKYIYIYYLIIHLQTTTLL